MQRDINPLRMVLQRMMSVWNGLHHHVGSSGFGFKLSQARPTNLSRAADLFLQCMYDDVSSEDKYLYGVEFTKLKYWWLTANSTSDFSISFCWCNSECTSNCLECLFQRHENAWGSSSLSWIQCDIILFWCIFASCTTNYSWKIYTYAMCVL